MRTLVSKINWPILIVACATIGLAPLFPEPHVWEKLRMMVQGNLILAIDWFDLLMHDTPWVLVVLKIWGTFGGRADDKG
jgi:hypothetical protein